MRPARGIDGRVFALHSVLVVQLDEVADARLLDLCKLLIAASSISAEGTRRIAELCATELLAPAGIEAKLVPSSTAGANQVNLIAIVPGREAALTPIVLNTHLDTVPPGDPTAWTQCGGNPLSAAVAGDRIYGLGSADTKLDFVAKASALTKSRRPKRTVYLIGSFGEEHGLLGAKEITAAGFLPRGALAFVGEPSHLAIVTAHKGFMAFELTLRPKGQGTAAEGRPEVPKAAKRGVRIVFNGKAAHSSTPHLGRNAIVSALEFIVALPAPVEVIAIEGGDALNKVPARCTLTAGGDVPELPEDAEKIEQRPSPGYPMPPLLLLAAAKFAEALQNLCDRSGAEADYPAPSMTSNIGLARGAERSLRLEFEMRPPPGISLESARRAAASICTVLSHRFEGIEVELREQRANPGFRSPEGNQTVEIASAAMIHSGLDPKISVKAGCTEAGVYAGGGLKPVVFGPGPSSGVIHAPNEYNLMSEVEAAVRFYSALLEL